MRRVQKTGHTEVCVEAALVDVWDVVSDVTRVGEWSHECHSAKWLGGAEGPAPGARFRGRNRTGWARWSRTCEVLVIDPPTDVVWRTVPTALFPDSTRWRIHLQPTVGGTRIVQSFEVLRAPWVLDQLYALLIPAHQDRDARLADDLRRIGAIAAGVSR